MKCPLLAIAEMGVPRKGKGPEIDCLKEECAWWDRIDEQCGFLSLSHDIHWLRVTLQQIRDKMPHEEQFRR